MVDQVTIEPEVAAAPERSVRLAFDTGGTFTDLTIDGVRLYKSPTTPDDPVLGVLNVLDVAATDLDTTRRALLESADQIVYGTTRATNAVISGQTACTALLVTQGHPDILLWREGGKSGGPFDFRIPYPDPFIPRHLTFEIVERIGSQGEIVAPLDEQQARETILALKEEGVEAVAVCLLWSVVQPVHELQLGELLNDLLPGVPYTLSHQLNPTIREYRRASSASIDASLKPIMASFLRSLGARLTNEGFTGKVLVLTSAGGVLDTDSVSAAPIHTLASGPAAAPVAGRHFLGASGALEAIVTDAGGTSFDVSLIRRGQIPWTRETKIGRDFLGPMTGFPSIDVKSVGAGGGSIASVDGGVLRVGPHSAGAVPGPACYGLGGTSPTVTDACVVLGYLDPNNFLEGAMTLDAGRALESVRTVVAEPLGLTPHEAAAAILEVATEHMVNAIEDITMSQGVDPRAAVLISGGGSGGFYAGSIGRRIGCRRVLIPEPAAALSAVGALMSDLVADFAIALPASTAAFPQNEVNAALESLEQSCHRFMAGPGAGSEESEVTLSAEARYPQQIWDLEVPLPFSRFRSKEELDVLCSEFHRIHEDTLGIADPGSEVEVTTWRAKVRCGSKRDAAAIAPERRAGSRSVPAVNGDQRGRSVFFADEGWVETPVRTLDDIPGDSHLEGPLIINGRDTTIVVRAGMSVTRLPSGTIELSSGAAE